MEIAYQGLPQNKPDLQPTMTCSSGVVTGAIKSTPGSVFGLHCINANVAVRYLQLYNQAGGAPTGTPVAEIAIKPGDSNTVGAELFTVNGMAFSLGIVFGFSTTKGSYVAGTAADHSLTIATK